MKIALTILLTIICIATAFANSHDSLRYRAAPDEFSLMPWGDLWTNNPNYDEIFQDMYDCGFNLTTFIPIDLVKYAKKYNLGAVVQEYDLDPTKLFPGLSDDFSQNIESYKEIYKKNSEIFTQNVINKIGKENLDSIYLLFLQDEVDLSEQTVTRLKIYSDAVKRNIGCKPYFNHFPNYGPPSLLGGNYDKYLDTFVQKCGIDFISFDHYPFSMEKTPNAKGYTYNEAGIGFNEEGFYNNLESVRNASLRNNVKFINIIQSIGALHWPVPDDYMIHIQGWSSLAYGAKGLSYFTFYTIPMGNWREAPHDAYGFKSPTWRYVAHMNYAIHNISHIYKNLKSVNVFHIGNIPKGCKDISSAKVIKELKLKSLGGKVNACVGEFIDKNTGKEYIIIVNKNSKYSINIDSLIFNHGNILKSVNERSNDTDFKLFGGEGANIAPGHGLLLYAD